MVNPLDAVNAVIAANWPARFVYVDTLPKGFTRPSFFLQQILATPTPHTRTTAEWVVQLTLYCFVPTDDWNQQSQLDLLALQAEVLGLFLGGKIAAGDRYLTVQASAGGSSTGEAYVDITVTYADDIQTTAPEYDKMQDIQINYGRA